MPCVVGIDHPESLHILLYSTLVVMSYLCDVQSFITVNITFVKYSEYGLK